MPFRQITVRYPLCIVLFVLADQSPAQPPGDRAHVSGNAVLRGGEGENQIVITTTDRLAGAIHSLTLRGREFIDSHDHGRQLQSAASFDCGLPQPFWAECFNPTEAGSRANGVGNFSTSKLLRMEASEKHLSTTTQMAFWLAPNEKSFGHPALNDQVVSRHVVTKRVRIGYKHLPQVIDYEVVFTVPAGERHTFAQFEALTGYMPAAFDRFHKFDPVLRVLNELDDGPGEQAFPVAFSTVDGEHAMAIYSPDQPSTGYDHAGYGRFRFPAERVVKWNCVFRVKSAGDIPAGEHRFRLFVAIGTLHSVEQSLQDLHREFSLR